MFMKKITFFVDIIIGFVFISCNNNSIEIPVIKLNPLTNINQFEDSIFVSGIRSIYFEDKYYYLTDYERNRVFVLDENLNLLKSFGKGGKGPGEFLGAAHIYANNDIIYIHNDGKKTFELFKYGDHIKTIQLPYDMYLNCDMRYAIKDNTLYISNPNKYSSISKVSTKGVVLKNFGEIREYQTEKETIIKNFKHICFYRDNILSVSDCNTIIETYNMKFEKIHKYNYSEIPIVKKLLNAIQKEKFEKNSYFRIVSDIYVNENKLYLLIASIGENGKKVNNKILQFEIKDKVLKPLNILDLGEGWFGPICVSKNSVVSFNHKTSELIKYDLP